MDTSHDHASVSLAQYLSVLFQTHSLFLHFRTYFKVGLKNLLISTSGFQVHVAFLVKLDLSLIKNYATCCPIETNRQVSNYEEWLRVTFSKARSDEALTSRFKCDSKHRVNQLPGCLEL